MSQTQAAGRDLESRLAEIERVCGIHPARPDTGRTLATLAAWIAELQAELRAHRHQFNRFVSDADPTRRLP